MAQNWRENMFVSNGKQKQIGLKSWWAEPELQADRKAFERRLVDEELARMSGNQRFGGAKRIHDDGIK